MAENIDNQNLDNQDLDNGQDKQDKTEIQAYPEWCQQFTGPHAGALWRIDKKHQRNTERD